jgi:hypothetical protein
MRKQSAGAGSFRKGKCAEIHAGDGKAAKAGGREPAVLENRSRATRPLRKTSIPYKGRRTEIAGCARDRCDEPRLHFADQFGAESAFAEGIHERGDLVG